MPPIVSINLCCYNSQKYLEETLQSIFAQTYKDWELIIINDGSTDATESIVKKYISQGYPIIYHFQKNHGLGYSRNEALKRSQGEYIAFIDHDDLWIPTKLEKQMPLFNGRPNIGVVYSDGIIFFLDGTSELYSYYYSRRKYRGQVLAPLLLNNFVLCPSIMIRRTALDQVGWFNPEYNQAEEYELLLRIAERYNYDYVDEPLAKYRVHTNNAGQDILRAQNECLHIFQKTMNRHPLLYKEFGTNVVRLRLNGIGIEVGEAHLLHGDWRKAYLWYGSWNALLRTTPRLLNVYIRSLLLPHHIITLRRLRKLMRR